MSIGAALIGGLASLGQGILQRREDRRIQKKTWEREDTAVQRRAADLEAAGLSKTLAAGSPAQTTAVQPASFGNPIQDGMDAATTAMNLMRQKTDIAHAKATTRKTTAEAKFLEETMDNRKGKLHAERWIADQKANWADTIHRQEHWINEIKGKLDIARANAVQQGETYSRVNQAMKEVLIEQGKWNLEIAKRLGIPTGGGDAYTRAAAAIIQALRGRSGLLEGAENDTIGEP